MFVCGGFIFIGPSCRHIKKGTDQTLLKKVSGNSNWRSCQDCVHEENKENISNSQKQDSEQEEETAVVWMCLKCGHRVSLLMHLLNKFWQHMKRLFLLKDQMYPLYQGCGRNSENQHAIKHYETPRSDTHCLVICLDNWSVWWVCYRAVLITYTCRARLKYNVHYIHNVHFCHVLLNLQVLHLWWWSPLLQYWTTGSAGDQTEKTNLCPSREDSTEQ